MGPSVSAFTYNLKTVPTLSYVSQLCFSPNKIWEIGRTKLHRLFHLPNTLVTSDFMNWDELGLPKIVSLRTLNIASLVRTANKTLSDWRGLESSLRIAGKRNLPVSVWSSGSFYPAFWKNTPFVQNLKVAADNTFADEEIRVAVGSVLSRSVPPPKLQQQVSNAIRSRCFNTDWKTRIAPKARVIHSDFDADFIALDLDRVIPILKSLGESIATCVFETWVNGWITADRLQGKSTFFCVVGCQPCADSLSHYVWCSSLWDSVVAASPFQVSLGALPDQRICLCEPEARDFKTLAAAYHLYNGARAIVKDTNLPISDAQRGALARHAWYLVSLAH